MEVEVISLPVPLALEFLEQRVLPVGEFPMDGTELGAWARSEAEEGSAGRQESLGRGGNAAGETQIPHTPLLPKSSKNSPENEALNLSHFTPSRPPSLTEP